MVPDLSSMACASAGKRVFVCHALILRAICLAGFNSLYQGVTSGRYTSGRNGPLRLPRITLE
ncbi:hypothetical protein LAB1_28980 [Roseibium sp. LAB1]